MNNNEDFFEKLLLKQITILELFHLYSNETVEYDDMKYHIECLNNVFYEMACKHKHQIYRQKYIEELISIEKIEKDKKEVIDYNILRLINLEMQKINFNKSKIGKYKLNNGQLPIITKYWENFKISRPVKFLEKSFVLDKYSDYTNIIYYQIY